MHSSIKFTNNADTFLTEAIITTTTVLPVIEKSTAVFPKIDVSKDQYFMLLLVDAEDNNKMEYLKCVDCTDSTFTVIRAQEGTEALNFPSNSRVLHIASAQSLQDIQDQSRIVRAHATDTPVYGAGTAQEYGHVKLTDNFELGTQAIDSIACTPQALHQAVARLIALPKEQLFTSSTTWTCPETGAYTITCVGGGGSGGSGGYGAFCINNISDGGTRHYVSGAGGGGGGAGQTLIKTIQCTKNTVYGISVGAARGTSSFGANLVVGLPGGNGGKGGNSSYTADSCTPHPGSGGNLGISYGINGSNGSSGIHKTGGDCIPAVSPGIGGSGANSLFGAYGQGGIGGNGQTNTQECSDRAQGPYSGTIGTQGCIKIVYPLGT